MEKALIESAQRLQNFMKKNNPLILSAHQPVYLPWLGLFHKIALADVFCVFDIVQYQRKDYNNRNKIKTSHGPKWLTVPVKSAGRFDSFITNIEIINNGWQKKHLRSIELNYKKSLYFEKIYFGLKKILDRPYRYLVDLNFDLLIYLLKIIEIDTKIIKASDYSFEGSKSDLVLNMCTKLNADIYIFGEKGKNYADLKSFDRSEVKCYFQSYNHPSYRQINNNFEPNLSVLDLIFNEGKASKSIIMNNNSTKFDIIKSLYE